MKIKIIAAIISFLVSASILACSLSATNALEARDVKYYFDNIELFTEKLPRQMQQKVLIKGRIVEFDADVVCEQGPCPPVKMTALEDINDKNYNIIIYEGNPLIRELKIGQVYTLQGVLEKGVDFGRRTVYISSFDAKRIIAPGKE